MQGLSTAFGQFRPPKLQMMFHTRVFSLFGLLSFGLFAMPAQAQWRLDNGVNIAHSVFLHPESGPYVEVSLNIHGKALRFEESEAGQYRASAMVTILLRDEEEVVDFVKYRLESPPSEDTLNIDFALSDNKRLLLPKSNLILEVSIEDLFREGSTMEYEQPISTGFADLPAFSDLQFIDHYQPAGQPGPFSKSGMDMVPYAARFYPEERNVLVFYSELYGSTQLGEGEQFLLTWSIREKGSEKINPNFWQYQKASAADVVPALREFDLSDLPSGNYELVAELRNRQNDVLHSRRAFFQRLNSKAVYLPENIAMIDISDTWAERYSKEQLTAFMDFIHPVAEPTELNLISSFRGILDSTVQQRFLYNFWLKRHPDDAYKAWLDYLELVKKANDRYSTTSAMGYRTDRGRVLLKYGEPNDVIARVNEPGAFPYEMWMYYTLADGQNNIRFIFYEPTLVTNNYQLIHSNAIGELQDWRWKMRVYGKTANPSLFNNFDAFSPQNSYGGNAGQLEDDAGNSIFNQGRP